MKTVLALVLVAALVVAGSMCGCIDKVEEEWIEFDIPPFEEWTRIDIGDFNDTEDWIIAPLIEGGHSCDLTDILKEGTDQTKSAMNKAQLVDSIAKGTHRAVVGGDSEVEVITYKDCIYDVIVTGDRFINNMDVSDGVISENGSSYTAPKVVKFKAGSDLATKVK